MAAETAQHTGSLDRRAQWSKLPLLTVVGNIKTCLYYIVSKRNERTAMKQQVILGKKIKELQLINK
jgi:hypothetical protein